MSNVRHKVFISYHHEDQELKKFIDDAFNARTARNDLIANPRVKFVYNRNCRQVLREVFNYW